MWIVTKEAITALIRTFMGYAYAWLLTLTPGFGTWLTENGLTEQFDGAVGFITIILGVAIYGAIRWAAERWGWIGYFLVVNKKPEYDLAA